MTPFARCCGDLCCDLSPLRRLFKGIHPLPELVLLSSTIPHTSRVSHTTLSPSSAFYTHSGFLCLAFGVLSPCLLVKLPLLFKQVPSSSLSRPPCRTLTRAIAASGTGVATLKRMSPSTRSSAIITEVLASAVLKLASLARRPQRTRFAPFPRSRSAFRA